ncbi:MAG: hypothetical protein FWF65_04045, partial [Bacteroidetes bacterium]|nr:hypothetical protein [Bacteroidota bacterium]
MKQNVIVYLLSAKKNTLQFYILFLLGFFVFNMINHRAIAQTQITTLTWQQDPVQYPRDLVVLGDPGYIYLSVKLIDDAANNTVWRQPRIKIDLPAGIDFSQSNVTAGTNVSNILINEPGVTTPVTATYFTTSTAPSGAALSGTRSLTIQYIANGNANTGYLRLGDSIVLKIRIRALWEANALNPGSVKITMSSAANQTLLGGVEKTCQLNLVRPTLRITPTPPYSNTIIFNNILDTMLVSVNIDAQNGHTRSALIAYTYNSNYVYLDNFKLDGRDLPLLMSNSGGGVFHNTRISGTALPGPATAQITYIRLDQTTLQNTNITDVPRTLTFRATTNRGCNWELVPWIQNPLVPTNSPSPSTSYDRWNDNPTILSLPGVRGAPTFLSQNTNGTFTANNSPVIMRRTPRFNMNNPNDLTGLRTGYTDTYSGNGYQFITFCWDGETPNYATLALYNNNGIPSIACEFRTYLDYYTNLSYCEYYDTTQIYYRITCPSKINGADSIVRPVTRLKASDVDFYGKPCIDARNDFPSTNADIVAQYNPILWNKSRYMTLRVPDIGMDNPLPANAIVEFQWVVYGNPNWINDAYRAKSSFTTTNTSYNHISHSWNTPRYESTCGDVNQTGGVNVSPNISKPRFTATGLPRVAVYSQHTFYWSNPTNTGSNNTTAVNNPTSDPTGARYAEYFVKMPPWLDLDITNTIEDAFIIRNRDSITFYPGGTRPTANSGVFYGEDENGYKTYSVRYHGSYDGVLDIRLKPGDCPEEIVFIDTIQAWVDWISGSDPRNVPSTHPSGYVEECRGRFRKTSKVFTVLEFICTPPALAIDTFGVFRITRGLKDSNNDHLPDDGSLALDREIDHRHFMEDDTGYYFFRGYVGGASTERYDKLVLVLKYGTGGAVGATYQYKWGTTGNTVPLWTQGTIDIKRWNEDKTDFTLYTLPLDIPVVTNQDSIIIYYDGGKNDYVARGGDSCYLRVPFRCRLGINGNIRGNFYTITYGIRPNDQTQTWVSKYFPNGIYRIVFRNFTVHGPTAATFLFSTPCEQVVVNNLYSRTYHGGDEISDWPREVRYRHRIDKIILRVPCGFSRTNNKIYLRPWKYYNSYVDDAYNFAVVPDLAEEDFLTQDSIFTIDMKQYIDVTYDGSQGYSYNVNTGLLSNGKFPPGDDVAGVYATFKNIFATPASTRTSLTNTWYYTNSMGNPQGTGTNSNTQTSTGNANTLNYTGRKLQMDLQTYVIMFNQVAFSSLKLTNANGSLTNKDTWLFVKGNVCDAYLLDIATRTDTIKGVGKDNCWVPVGTMSGGEVRNYFLVYTYKGNDVCENDTITVYSAFNASDVPEFSIDINQGIEQVHACNRGEKKYTALDLLTARVKVAGYIEPHIPNSAKPNYLHFNQGYAMDYVVNGKVSQGALNDPFVTFRIPAGQIYADHTAFGVASFEYPQGSGFRPFPNDMLTALEAAIGSASQIEESRVFTIHIKDLLEKEVFMLPGWGYTPMNFQDIDRVFTIRIPLLPFCETDLTGIRFRAAFNGATFCGSPCEDDGTVYITPTILSDIVPEYRFKVSMTNVSSSRVYSNEQRRDVLKVSFKKEGLGIAVNELNYVVLRVSENMVIDGNVTCVPFGNIDIDSMKVNSEGERFYFMKLPINDLNALIGGPPPADTLTFTYTIPVLFNPDPNFDCSVPRQELECQVISASNFDQETGTCEVNPLNIGSDALRVLTLDYDPDLFYVCLNMPNPLTFACGSVTPIWYRDSVGTGGQLIADNTFIYTPVAYKDTTFWLRIIYDYNGPLEENFGLTHIKVKMYPLVTAQFRFLSSCVGQETIFRNESTIGGEPSTSANTDKWYWYLNGATTPFDDVREPTKLLADGDVVKLVVISKDGCRNETSVTARPFPLPVPAITGSLDTCFRHCVTYRTTSGMSNYVWTVSNGTATTPLTGRDSLNICWDKLSSPIPGLVGVIYTDNNGCVALPKEDIARVIIRVPPTIPGITGNDRPCLYSETTYNFVYQDNIEYFDWTVTGGVIIAGGDGYTYVTVRWTTVGAQTITLAIANRAGCEAIQPGELSITVLDVTKPTILGDDELCLNSEEVTYTTQADMTNYHWYINGGTVTAGSATNEATVVWNNAGTGKLAVSYTLANGCPTAMVDTFEVTLLPLPKPNVLNGTKDTCFLECDVYTTETGMSHYEWSVINGTIAGDNDLDHVTVCWDDAPGNGYLTIKYNDDNNCRGTGRDTVIVRPFPDAPVISGEPNPCSNIFEPYTYTTASGMQNYQWYIEGGTIVENNERQIKVFWNSSGSCKLAVSYENSYGCLCYDMVDTLKPNVHYCNIIDCDVTEKTVVEDSCYVGYYTHSDNLWDIIPVSPVIFDSVTYIINDTLTIRGTAATLNGVTFTSEATSAVVCIAYYQNIVDTCIFDVTVNAAGVSAVTTNIDAEDVAICVGSKATLTATSTIENSTFLWYETQNSDIVLHKGDSFETAPLYSDTAFYVSVYGDDYCENLAGYRKKVAVTLDPLSNAGITSNDTTICYNRSASVSIAGYTGTI